MTGKDKCRILKEIRCKIANENKIPYITEECDFKGNCSGTCPKCEAELQYLEVELEKRKSIGKRLAVTGLAAGLLFSFTGCTAELLNTPSDQNGLVNAENNSTTDNTGNNNNNNNNDDEIVELEGDVDVITSLGQLGDISQK